MAKEGVGDGGFGRPQNMGATSWKVIFLAEFLVGVPRAESAGSPPPPAAPPVPVWSWI